MKAMDRINPLAAALYFILAASIPMFSLDPILISVSVLCAAALTLSAKGAKKRIGFAAAVLCASALVNTLFSHNGATVLFFIGEDRITLEALLFGLAMGGAMSAVILWFSCFSVIMTSDKLLYIFGKLSPKLSLILSMGLRYISLLSAKAKEIKRGAEGMGISEEENLIKRLRSKIFVFSALVTWALENGITTADSMSARGYGVTKRTPFSIFSFSRKDLMFLSLSLVFFTLTILGSALNGSGAEYYPTVSVSFNGWLSYMTYLSYGALALTPVIIEAEEALRWRYLRSKI